MADTSMRITNFPDSGSPERVALDLLKMVFSHEGRQKMARDDILDLYAECLYTARGLRDRPKK
ncbi:hypothetical protein [Sphingosinicella sp. LY1275]|uniref:hypothetical protein n=1 Tax=Sphingosinicella sp. LY1275 TaxID=3095379 RepID=UPI002ADED46F|nr:hypothetical protein [Sphingosinicella sp. LY1275]MEA1015598.1 hypothetical protein [Sphingosinicella sp. LY1275]